MKKINWLYVGVGAVVLYMIYKRFYAEDKASAGGMYSLQAGKKCQCTVTINGQTYTHECKCRKCDDFCGGAINIETQNH